VEVAQDGDKAGIRLGRLAPEPVLRQAPDPRAFRVKPSRIAHGQALHGPPGRPVALSDDEVRVVSHQAICEHVGAGAILGDTQVVKKPETVLVVFKYPLPVDAPDEDMVDSG
jgi:hypothetical protein